jgi:MYXO-CTERM domain-containing protein
VTRAREWATSLVATQSLVSLSLTASPNDVQPGGSIVYQIQVANLSTNTATGTFMLEANVPRFTSVTGTSPQATCANFSPATGCRFGENMFWSVPSIAAGGNTVLQFTVSVDNSATNPAPPTGTLLFADATALVFGTVRANTDEFVGNVTPIEPGDSGVGGGQGSVDGGLDVGDAGSPDATVESDASIDGGDDGSALAADAGSAGNGDSGADAGVVDDGGPGSDASRSAATDAGTSGSVGSGSTSNGCSCTAAGSESTGTLPLFLAGGLGFMTLRRRKTRAPRLHG